MRVKVELLGSLVVCRHNIRSIIFLWGREICFERCSIRRSGDGKRVYKKDADRAVAPTWQPRTRQTRRRLAERMSVEGPVGVQVTET